MSNFKAKSGSWTMPSTLKEYEQQIRKQSADSSTSENQTAGQPEVMKTLEVRFVPVHSQIRKQPISVEPNLSEMPANIPSVDAPKLTIEDS